MQRHLPVVVEVVMEIDDVADQHLGSGKIFLSPLPNSPTRSHGQVCAGVVWCGCLALAGLDGSGPLYGSLPVELQFPPPWCISGRISGCVVVGRLRPITPSASGSLSPGSSRFGAVTTGPEPLETWGY
jgi:hypothetical protein